MTTVSALGGAGQSATAQADLYADFAQQTEQQIHNLLQALRELRKREGAHRVGAEGERRSVRHLQRVLVDLGASDWHLLTDRRWPGTRRANIDVLLVGPPGVLVLDVKTWRDARVADGALWHGQERADEDLAKVRDQALAVAERLADIGLAPATVLGYVVLSGLALPTVPLSGVSIVGELTLQRELVRLGARLTAAQVDQVVGSLEEVCPPARPAARSGAVAIPGVDAAATSAEPPTELIELEEIYAGVIEAVERGPVEAWMSWLHPAQARLATRTYGGPARLRGAAGTGKTVVALHRARQLAQRPGARVLVTSYVRTLPEVLHGLFDRLAPDTAAAVEFRGLHSWARGLLASRGIQPRVVSADEVFPHAWETVGSSGPSSHSSLPRRYWQEEITSVIKGRGLTRVEDYLALQRVGRRTPLREDQRLAAWALFEEYQKHLRQLGAVDWEDLLQFALDSVLELPVSPPYTSVVVDEVQDLTCTGMRLLYALVGDADDGLFLVGDGQQSVYPGGFTLSEAGVTVTGRATVLDHNYRNGAEIFRRALVTVSADRFEDLDAEPEPGSREVRLTRDGGQVATVRCEDAESQRAALLHALRWTIEHGTRPGDIGVLARSRREVQQWSAVLLRAGIAVVPLDGYDGRTVDAVKVGTYLRAKGLEFACVMLPDHDRAVPAQSSEESDEAYQDRAELQRRQLFVAMTRARDRLWLGSVGALPSSPARQ